MLVAYICITTCSAIFAEKGALGAGRATIAFIYIVSQLAPLSETPRLIDTDTLHTSQFNMFYAISFTAIGQGLYPLEILPYGIRTKGFMICGFTSIAAAFFNIYVNPIVLEAM